MAAPSAIGVATRSLGGITPVRFHQGLTTYHDKRIPERWIRLHLGQDPEDAARRYAVQLQDPLGAPHYCAVCRGHIVLTRRIPHSVDSPGCSKPKWDEVSYSDHRTLRKHHVSRPHDVP